MGVDLDNTLACYDGVFHRLALERGLVSRDVALTKEAVRAALCAAGREGEWTALQGEVYGPGMQAASPFPGALAFLETCRRLGVPVSVVSHRTRTPFHGAPHDLHRSGRDWLRTSGLLDTARTGLADRDVHLEETRAGKLTRIAALGCTHFVDDLPEILADPAFPEGVVRVLFDPAGAHRDETRFERAGSWAEVARWVKRWAALPP